MINGVNHEQLIHIFNNTSDLVFLMKKENDSFLCVNVNPSYYKHTHLKPEQVIGRFIEDILEEPSAKLATDKYWEALNSKKTISYEETIYYRNGDRTFDVTLIPIFEGVESPHLLGIARDITDKKIYEEQIIQSEKLAVVGELAAGVAHELRKPLTSLKGFLQLIQAEIESKKVQSYLSIMSSEFERIEQIINEFLLLAKPQNNICIQNNIVSILNDVLQLMISEANLKSIIVELHFDDTEVMVCCDSHQIKQVFINVIKNAIEAMENGGIIQIRLSTTNSGKVAIAIIDEGRGIAPELLCKLGQPFYSTKDKGTGLGLMICNQIISRHGGELNITSTPNTGTTVEITLPLLDIAE